MKRLQLRHHDSVFDTRQQALDFFDNIVDVNRVECVEFGETLFAEPMVAKYYDANNNEQVLVAIGVNGGHEAYHIIDSAKIKEDILANAAAILAEENRVIDVESAITISLNNEIVRAIAREGTLSSATVVVKETLSAATVAEQERAISEETIIKNTVSGNVVKIYSVSAVGANVKEEFVLKNAKGEELGAHIKIYKDSSLVGAQLGYAGAKLQKNEDTGEYIKNEDGDYVFSYESIDENTEYLYLIYKDSDEKLRLVSIDFEQFLTEDEYGNGLQKVGHKISVRIADADEGFLSSTEFGIKTSGITTAINTAKDAAISASKVYADAIVSNESGIRENEDHKMLSSANTYTNIKFAESKSYTDSAKTSAILSAKTYTDGGDTYLQHQITSNKLSSKDVVLSTSKSGTVLTIQTDEETITKFASAATIYDSNVAVLGSLLKIKEVTPSSETIKLAYELQNGKGVKIGDTIEIPKESALYKVEIGYVGDTINEANGNYAQRGTDTSDKALNFIYLLADGKYSLTSIRIADYFTDTLFGQGLSNQDGKISIVAGDGNEYLVVGQDTISVVGVNAAIATAKSEAIASAKTYTNEKITDVTSSVNTLSDTINTAINGMNETLNTAIEGMNSTLTAATDSMSTTLNARIDGVEDTLDAETSNRETADTNLSNQITALTQSVSNTYATKNELSIINSSITNTIKNTQSALTAYVDTKDSNINTSIAILSSSTVTEMKALDAENLITAKDYANQMASAAVSTIKANEVEDVVYNSAEKIIKLKLKNGVYTTGFDASTFLVDGMLSNVSLSGNNLVFVWNTDAGNKELSVELSKFVNVYSVETGRTYIGMNEQNVISLYVDNEKGYSNTLASTNFVKTAEESAKAYASAYTDAQIEALDLENTYESKGLSDIALESAKDYTDEVIDNLRLSATYDAKGSSLSAYNESVAYTNASVTSFSANVKSTIDTIDEKIALKESATYISISGLSGNVINYVNAKDTILQNNIDTNTSAIEKLNGGKDVQGSVKHIVEDKFTSDLIVNGLPATDVTITDAEAHSLMRAIIVDGERMYYVSNKAENMLYKTSDGSLVNLNNYISGLETRVANLENTLVSVIKSTIKDYLKGTQNEIKVSEKNEKLEIGFADDAVFGYLGNE